MRKTYTADFKAKAALEVIKGVKSLSEVASKFEVHPTQLRSWKKSIMQGLPEILSGKRGKKAAEDDAEKAKLYEEIGRLKVELDWLKKKSAIFED